ncbi:MAG TPA: hypothetical protein DCS90_04335 [Ktedonobacter sp.]|nr:hypothetical protein [Ktedonobacter sp.]
MAKIYISSTFADLKDYREKVYHALRQMHHDAIAMEDYVATDQRPLDRCLADVAACDLYIGIFAWRYGYIPPKDNPEQKSITELEYRSVDAFCEKIGLDGLVELYAASTKLNEGDIHEYFRCLLRCSGYLQEALAQFRI